MFDKRKDGKQDSPQAQDFPVQQDNYSNRAPQPASTAVIGPGIKVNGEISGEENLIIKGAVEGSVKLGSHRVDIDQSGRVTADVTAKVIEVSGQVQGDITGNEKVTISKAGNVRGNIVAPRVILEDGAKFKGSIDMNPAEAVAAELPLAQQRAVKKPDNVKSIKEEAAVDSSVAVKGG